VAPWERLVVLSHRNPLRAWRIVVRVLDDLPAPEVDPWPYESLGADALENVMGNGGQPIVERAIALLDHSPRFAEAARHVILAASAQPTWEHELRIRGLAKN
jgi:hypothetical protein